ncbi:MAG: preprotein translocase subunit SecY [Opitutae bacterium]|nr:preprotein translocase subunit SecY [Opitutae bacterium]
MFSAFFNCWRVPELRNRIIVTIGLIFISRIGGNLPLPGIDMTVLTRFVEQLLQNGNGAVGLYNAFTGGAMLKGAIFALGIMPYISASIIMQLMGAVLPSLARLRQEENGQQKIAQYTRYVTIVIAIVQGLMVTNMLSNPATVGRALGVHDFQGAILVCDKVLFIGMGTLILTAGAVIMTWLGEQITQRGIGNGASILIVLGIVADMPQAVAPFITGLFGEQIVDGTGGNQYGVLKFVGMLAMFVIGSACLVLITQAVRKIPVQYAKRIVGRKMYGGQTTYLPMKVNYAGVMPVIFAGAILSFISMPLMWLGSASPSLNFLIPWSAHISPGSDVYYILMAAFVFTFSFFWVSVMFKPIQVADDLKKNNGYIPGIRPGQHTAAYLEFVMNRLTFAGGVFLVIIAILPDVFIYELEWFPRLARVVGGTSGLIAVGVVLDTMRQVESLLLQRHYDGFLKKSRIGGIAIPATNSRRIADVGVERGIGKLSYVLLGIFLLGLIAFGANAWQKRAATAAPASAEITTSAPAAPQPADGDKSPAGGEQ